MGNSTFAIFILTFIEYYLINTIEYTFFDKYYHSAKYLLRNKEFLNESSRDSSDEKKHSSLFDVTIFNSSQRIQFCNNRLVIAWYCWYNYTNLDTFISMKSLRLPILFLLVAIMFYFTFINGVRYHKFVEFERAAKNESREIIVKNTLKNAAGVYMDKRHDSLSKTVMITVAAFNEIGKSFYKVYFKNFICFAKHYNYDLVVYILHHDIPNLERELDSIRRLGVRVLTYPDELFWNTVATKKSPIIRGILLYCSVLPS